MRRALVFVFAMAVAGFGAASTRGQTGTLVAYDAIAAGEGVRVELHVEGAPLSSNLFDGGAPLAQARINGLGVSSGLASMPYPGENATTLPGLLFPLIGLPAPPAYPLLATSAHPTRPVQEIEVGGVRLAATSTERAAAGEATTNVDGTDGATVAVSRAAVRAEAFVDDATADVVTAANGAVESVLVAGVLRIGGSEWSASARRSPTGELAVGSSFTATAVTVAGTTVSVGPEGILLPGSSAPVPDTAGASSVLDATGISLAYLQPQPAPDGIVSAGLVVRFSPPSSGATYTLTFGRARAFVTASGRPAASATPPAASPAPPVPSGSAAAPSQPGSSSAVVTPPLAQAPTAPAAASPGAVSDMSTTSFVSPLALGSFYLVLAAGAAVALAGCLCIRFFGQRVPGPQRPGRERSTWRS